MVYGGGIEKGRSLTIVVASLGYVGLSMEVVNELFKIFTECVSIVVTRLMERYR